MSAVSKEVISKIQAIVPSERVKLGEYMKEHTSFKIGGPSDVYVEAHNELELKGVLKLMAFSGTEHLLVGNGSNFLVSDAGYRGVIIKLAGDFEYVEAEGSRLKAGAASLLSSVSTFAAERGLSGLEFASGIPGSIGGAIFMNAGAYGGEMKDVVKRVTLLSPDGEESFTLSGEEMNFSYRNSGIQESGAIVMSVEMELREDNPEDIKARISELREKRNSKQPVQYPSAGSTFKRPVGGFAAALIEEAGLKGFSVGGAQVSEKHSGFVINTGDASCADVVELMKQVRQRVYDNAGIVLEPEVRIIGEEWESF